MEKNIKFIILGFFFLGVNIYSLARDICINSYFTQINMNQKFANRNQGKRALEDRIYNMALKFFIAYRDENKNDIDCYTEATSLIAETALIMGQIETAQEAILLFEKETKAIKKESSFYDAFICIKSSILVASGKSIEAKTLLENFLPNFTNLEEKERGQLLLANINIQLNIFNDAAIIFEELKKSSSTTIQAGGLLGDLKICLLRGKIEDAKLILTQLKTFPVDSHIISLYQILILLQEKQNDEAYEIYKAIESSRPMQSNYDWWLTSTKLAERLTEQGKFEEAINLLEQSILFSLTEQNKIIAQLKQADIYVRLEKINEAITILQRFRIKYKNLPELYTTDLKIGDLARNKKDYTMAITYYTYVAENKNIEISQRYKAQFNIGKCLQATQKFTLSAQSFLTAYELTSIPQEKAEALQLAAEVLFLAKEYKESAEIYAKITKDFPLLPIAEDALRAQGRVYFEGKMYKQAIIIYKSYLRLYPQGRHNEMIELEYGLSLREEKQNDEALKIFKTFLTNHPLSLMRAKILEEAYKTALLTNNTNEAELLISEITKNYSDTIYYPKAFYWRTYIAFVRNDKNAEQLAQQFISEIYGKKACSPSEIIDVYFWLADLYNNQQLFDKARQLYTTIYLEHGNQPEVARAIYEAARCSLFLKEYEQGLTLLSEVENHPLYIGDLKFLCLFLKSDLQTALTRYKDAISSLTNTLEIAPIQSKNWWIAKGRIAELHIALGIAAKAETSGEEVTKHFKQALIHINDCLLEGDKIPSDIHELLLFNKAVTLENLQNIPEAFDTYYEIVLNYDNDLQKKPSQRRDWKILERSAFKAADLAIQRNDFDQASRIYQRIIKMKLPLAKEAKIKLQSLNEKLKSTSNAF